MKNLNLIAVIFDSYCQMLNACRTTSFRGYGYKVLGEMLNFDYSTNYQYSDTLNSLCKTLEVELAKGIMVKSERILPVVEQFYSLIGGDQNDLAEAKNQIDEERAASFKNAMIYVNQISSWANP